MFKMALVATTPAPHSLRSTIRPPPSHSSDDTADHAARATALICAPWARAARARTST